MSGNVNPTVRRRRLGQELRRLREDRGMTAEEVADRLLVSQSKISRLENGRRSISPRDVRDLCGVYEVEDAKLVDSLMQMAKESRQQGWWHAFAELSPSYSVYIGLETDASSLRVYEPQVVPGLLQTPAYAGAVISGALPEVGQDEVASRVQVRLRRQQRIWEDRTPLRLWAVVDESALRRAVGGPATMAEQLRRLEECSRLPHVTLQVMPFSAGAHPGVNGQYTIMEFSEAADTTVIYLEGGTNDLYLEKPHDVQHYSIMYEHLRAQAYSPEQTRRFVLQLAEEFDRQRS
ncbi:helix-turn-helix domain-containing protein [Streptomyces sp. 3MP-14]|uniref:Helix-turn-helix domain-containing protein n=1 Tax=Streptomyces mimosae TaxID=2586635 RepID=A0A5N6A665_9ACTN|nr:MULTISPECIES: helix-turn-helix transcriptional regulator [Streptomyces]KAB8164294.1 helix-turn-helix domain-containing protein [Streptomyces mimosae]KAB8176571.1 helix-turn-helix domain-containing protein [Streptomyces sp. 3MP-14]